MQERVIFMPYAKVQSGNPKGQSLVNNIQTTRTTAKNYAMDMEDKLKLCLLVNKYNGEIEEIQ